MGICAKINDDGLWNTIKDLSKIGKDNNGGNTRLSFSESDMLARQYIMNLLIESGLEVRIDEVGNIFGRLNGEKSTDSVVMTGSHIDTVLNGGKFDGALGVLGAIEAVRTIKEQHIKLSHSIEIVSFTDEEGTRFGTGFIGSRGLTGRLTYKDLQLTDNNGTSYTEAFHKAGINIENYHKAVRKPESIKAYLEMHIEQGRVLETEDIPIGIVSNIKGAIWLQVTVRGQADHAGATPMHLRKDPSLVMAEALLDIEKIALRWNGVATVGKMELKPGAENIIPEEVTFLIDLRHGNKSSRKHMEVELISVIQKKAAQRGLEVAFEVKEAEDPATCSVDMIKTIEAVMKQTGVPIFKMNCGAGHDALLMSNITEIGMILVRSKDGISHNPLEWSSKEDCSIGTQVLMNSLINIAK